MWVVLVEGDGCMSVFGDVDDSARGRKGRV